MATSCTKLQRDTYFKQLVRQPYRTQICDDSGRSSPDLTNPIYKKFARICGHINQMSEETLQDQLRALGAGHEGSTMSLQQRLKNRLRAGLEEKVEKKKLGYNYDLICVVDFEATCERSNGYEEEQVQIQEIIEFPAFLVDVSEMKIVASFHEYVKPIVNPYLSDFCTELTGITQHTVDKSDIFENVLDRFDGWLYRNIKERNCESFALATDG